MTTHPAYLRRLLSPRPAGGMRPGFTMIELLVAVSILSLMLGLAARIFYDAQSAVSRGMKTSQIIAEQRAVGQPFADDFRNMNVYESPYGANTPGFLMITQQAFDGVRFPPLGETGTSPDTWLADRDGDGVVESLPASSDDLMRSDQIALFRDADGLNALTPGGNDRYDSAARALNARVWYGHGWPVDVTASPADQDRPGAPGYDLATQLVLARQALLLVEQSGATTYPDGTPGDVGSTSSATNRVATSGSANPNANVAAVTRNGLVDVYDLRSHVRQGAAGTSAYSVYDDGGADPAGVSPRGLFRTPTYDITPTDPRDQSLFGSHVDTTTGLPTDDYFNLAALEWSYITPGRRLRVRTFLDNDFSAGIFTADQIGELHAAFSPHMADFAIEFAADFTDEFDTTDFDNDGNLLESDGLPDNEPDRDGAGNIVWYTTLNPNPDNASGDPRGPASGFNGVPADLLRASEPITYPVPNDVAAFNGTVGATQAIDGIIARYTGGSPDEGPHTLIWSHTGPSLDDDPITPYDDTLRGCGKYWPYLVRIRYRLMDGKGEFRSTDPITGEPVVGRWFEQVLIVPRPQGLF